jgi:ankyrin repeat protein
VAKRFAKAVAALALTAVSMPAIAQEVSGGFNFLKAVRERDGNKATSLLNEPGTTIVNTRDSSGETALHIVTRGHDLTWLAFLIGKNARIDAQNGRGETALSVAAQLGWAEGAAYLLSHGAIVDLANQRGETPLIFAVQRRDGPMVRLLLSHRADPRKTDHVAGYSALDYARQDPRAQPILRLLESSTSASAAPKP